jgi:hypothetical protein
MNASRFAVGLFATCLVTAAAVAQTNNIKPKDESPAPGTTLGAPQLTNKGEWRVPVFEGHHLSTTTGVGSILYCPSESDDPAFRAAISAAAGGATVDYFDTRAATPSVATLSAYTCVMTWANFDYFDNVGFGNNLAAYVDGGGSVILGAFCTYTTGNFLSGAIMTPGYCPVVSPTGSNHFSSSAYVGNGVTCIYDGVVSLDCFYRDILITQGGGIVDGTYADGEICHAYRPDGHVIYSNGNGGFPVTCVGDGALVIANACDCLKSVSSKVDCVCDGAFQLGDRVTLLVNNPDGNPFLFAGHQGTVICGTEFGFPNLLVMWDLFDGGHDGNGFCDCPSNGGGGQGGPVVLPNRPGWYVNCEEVRIKDLGCPWDFNGDGAVGFADLLKVLSEWGPCPL